MLNGTGGVSRAALPPGDYEVSFWAKGGRSNVVLAVDQELSWSQGPLNQKGFHLVRARVRVTTGTAGNPTGSISLDAQGREVAIDELRLHPTGAQMTTYTHSPFVGVTSTTDPSGRTTTYEYDGMGRLLRTRDEQGRILSQQQYHYAGGQ